MKKITLSILLLAFSTFLLIAQNKEVIEKMIEEVNYLASDKLEGRETGTAKAGRTGTGTGSRECE